MKTQLFAAVFLASSLPFTLLAQEPPAPEAAPLAPNIVCDEPNFDFGDMDNTGFVEHDYPIRNTGTLSLEIRDVHASCGCTAVKPSQNVVEPGGEATIHAKLDLRGRTGIQQKSITVTCNDPDTPTLILQLKGNAVQTLRADPPSLFFGRVGSDAVRERDFDVISSRGPYKVVSVRADNPAFTITEVAAEPGADGSRQRFHLALAADLPEGNINGNVYVKTDIGDQPEIAVPVAAYIANTPETPPATESAPAP